MNNVIYGWLGLLKQIGPASGYFWKHTNARQKIHIDVVAFISYLIQVSVNSDNYGHYLKRKVNYKLQNPIHITYNTVTFSI